MVIMEIDIEGNIVTSIDPDFGTGPQFPVTSRFVRRDDGARMVIGTYNTVPGRLPSGEDYEMNQSAGMFTAVFDEEAQLSMNYYNFLDFENLRTGMSRKEYYKMQRRSHKSSEEYSLNYSLLVHEIDTLAGNYILLLESFYPDYRTVSDITYDYWGRPIPQTYTIFEGYKYISGFVAAFDPSGELLWDNSMEIYNVSSYELGYKIDYLLDNRDMVFFYNEAGKITYKAIEEDMALTGLEHAELDTYHAGDKIVETGYDFMTPWYEDYYICHGYQKIRNNSMIEKNRRTIFYFAKVAFE
jgi:hypothetical protein